MFLQLRDEEELFGLISASESDEADQARKQADEAELKAQCIRKEIEQLLGKWVNHGEGPEDPWTRMERGSVGIGHRM